MSTIEFYPEPVESMLHPLILPFLLFPLHNFILPYSPTSQKWSVSISVFYSWCYYPKDNKIGDSGMNTSRYFPYYHTLLYKWNTAIKINLTTGNN